MMVLTATIGSRTYHVDIAHPRHLAIPMQFDGPQPNAYGVPPASARPFEGGGFIGDTRRGGSCNFETATLIPHCNGTHTECVGHIARERIAVHDTLAESLVPATVISVKTEPGLTSSDSYGIAWESGDMIITAASISAGLGSADPDFLRAIVIRTLPNLPGKVARQYGSDPAPFFSAEAMRVIAATDVRHLVVDIPSLDRARDEGRMIAHRIFWNVPGGTHDIDPASASTRTITELAYIPDEIPDGPYLLELQVAPFVADAAPSRPVLYPVAFLPEQA